MPKHPTSGVVIDVTGAARRAISKDSTFVPPALTLNEKGKLIYHSEKVNKNQTALLTNINTSIKNTCRSKHLAYKKYNYLPHTKGYVPNKVLHATEPH